MYLQLFLAPHFCLPTCAARDRFDPRKTFYLGRCSVILPQLTDIFFFPSSPSVCFLLSVSVSPAILSVPLRSSLSRPGPLDKVSVCVYLRAPSSAHYHENGLSPALILCVSVVINVFIQTLHSSGGRGWEDTAPAKKKYRLSRERCGPTCHLVSTQKLQLRSRELLKQTCEN